MAKTITPGPGEIGLAKPVDTLRRTQVPLFKTFSPAGTIALVQNLAPSIVLPGELIVRQVCRLLLFSERSETYPFPS